MNIRSEINTIENELKKLSPNKVIWDIEDPVKQPPWGKKISNQITDLSNYFITSDGRDFLTIFHKALDIAIEIKKDIILYFKIFLENLYHIKLKNIINQK